MKYHLFIISGLLLMGILNANAQVVSNDNEDGVYKLGSMSGRKAFIPGEVLVKFRDSYPVTVRRSRGRIQSTGQGGVDAVLKDFGVKEMDQLMPRQNPKRQLSRKKAYNGQTIAEKDLSQLYCVQIQSQRPDSVHMLIDRLKVLPEVEYAEPNYKAYIMGKPSVGGTLCDNPGQNPLYSQQWGLSLAGIDKLWTKPIVNAKRPVIAILDTGVDITHPALKDNVWTNALESEGEDDYDDDGDGFVDDVHGWDFVNDSPKMADYNSHGTHVAGIAAAADNGIGIVGANPQALFMPITVMQSDGSGDIRTIVKGIEYAVEHGATVINMSLGTPAYSQVLREALGYAYQTAVLVAAAGNDGKDISFPIYPAAHSFVLGVMATDEKGKMASFSNYDLDGPVFSEMKTSGDAEGVNYELSAPGVDVLSTVPNGNYKKMSGTSMATPLVAGAISALQMVKQYDSQEELWGDLIHADNNFETAYNITEHPAELSIVSLTWINDNGEEVNADELNAGETYNVYPSVKTTWGGANSIRFNLAVGEYEDASSVNILTNEVDFGYTLQPYTCGRSANPLVIKINPDCADSRHIRLQMTLSCNEASQPKTIDFSIISNKEVSLGGLLDKDTTLTANHRYHVISNIGVPKGVTLTIEPGVRLEFDEGLGINSHGKLIANGTPQKPITFTNHGEGAWGGINSVRIVNSNLRDTLSYCVFEYFDNNHYNNYNNFPYLKDCILTNLEGGTVIPSSWEGERVNIVNSCNQNSITWHTGLELCGEGYVYSNFINNYLSDSNTLDVNSRSCPDWSSFHNNNIFNTEPGWTVCVLSTDLEIIRNEKPSYLGSANTTVSFFFNFINLS